MSQDQSIAADPQGSRFVTAHAGTGKTHTLVGRVARLLLRGARPESLLCVTYTKAAAAEMQGRLFEKLGDWAVMADGPLRAALALLGEADRPLPQARKLFARALETPGGLKIQTIHAFCEKLLRRFPLEAGVSPSFEVLENQAAADLSAEARDGLARHVLQDPDSEAGRAYAHFAVQLDLGAFEALLSAFESERREIEAYIAECRRRGGVEAEVWRVCGFEDGAQDVDALIATAFEETDWLKWRQVIPVLLNGINKTDRELGSCMAALAEIESGTFEGLWGLFLNDGGVLPKRPPGTTKLPEGVRDFLAAEQARLYEALCQVRAATIAADTVMALRLAGLYGKLYENEKRRRGALDFDDLIQRTEDLLNTGEDAAWVLYKLDGGIDHILLDEAQDTAPAQWKILEALSGDFFSGEGAREAMARPVAAQPALSRTVFAVGDEKQSIYSFQGARPEAFREQRQRFDARATAAGRDFASPNLMESWRSAPEVLAFVDATFAGPDTQLAVPPPEGLDILTHAARREPGFGSVELWPCVQDEKRIEPDAWDAPQDAEGEGSARKRLARRIAAEIARITTSQAVVDKNTGTLRPARPGDVLVLVRKRAALFEEIIRALKAQGVPVAGADRLKLAGHGAFQDVLALARFALFPADDLALAGLLRSPFCDVAEESLFDLAYKREGSLWSVLRRRRGERAEWESAAALMERAIGEAGRRPPFDWLGRMLAFVGPDGLTLRRRVLTRLGREAEDALGELSAAALAAEGRGIVDLEGWVLALEHADLIIKREVDPAQDEPGGGEVRVMTVHGSKGLEAPIVFLPDTMGGMGAKGPALLSTPEGGFLFSPRTGDDCPAAGAARTLAKTMGEQEALRLLYVALTRARDRVIVAGQLAAGGKNLPRGSWYSMVSRAFEHPEIKIARRVVGEGDTAVTRFGPDPHPVPDLDALVPEPKVAVPDWLQAFAPLEPRPPDWAAPSAFTETSVGKPPSPLERNGGLGRFRRGEIIHRLLQILPDLPVAGRRAAASRLLAREPDLDDHKRSEMIEAAMAVLDDARFAEVFGPGSRAESALAGHSAALPVGVAISGRLDRIVVTPERVLVVDFKTNRPGQKDVAETDPAYLVQMAVYVALLREVYPDRPVEAALVWTDGPALTPIPSALIDETLRGLQTKPV